jgi:ribosomal protein S18 acetylase RimI-like enzyme
MIKITKGYKKADFDALLQINDLCYEGDERPPRETFAQMLEFSEVWVARDEYVDTVIQLSSCEKYHDVNTPIGFIIINEIHDINAYLWSMAVLPSCQGLGIGGRMLSLVCTEYKNRAIELHCRVDNPVQKMYFDYGFRVVDIARDYYKIGGRNIDGLKMRKMILCS